MRGSGTSVASVEEQPDFTHAWFPTKEFDESRVEGKRAAARSGGGTVVIHGSQPLAVVTEGPSAHAEVRQYGRATRWVVRVAEDDSLDAAASRFADLVIKESEGGDFIVKDPEYGTVHFRADGLVEAEGRRIAPKEFTVSGEATLLAMK